MSKSAKYRNVQKLVTEIFKVNIGLLPELISDALEFIKETYPKNEFGIQII